MSSVSSSHVEVKQYMTELGTDACTLGVTLEAVAVLRGSFQLNYNVFLALNYL